MTGLTDRLSERAALDRLLDAVRAGGSRALVVRGDPGVGKAALLDHLAGQASGSGCRVARAAGVQSEMELAFAGLHQLYAPMLSRAERLPAPQRDALRTVLGIAAGPPPDRFLVGLAVLSLLSEVATERPLTCLVDDEQWLDRASAQALGFAARRLAAEPVGLVFAARHAERAVAAAQAHMQAGAFGKALELLATAETGPLDEFASARVDLLRGQIAFVSNLGSDAPSLLLKAAKRLEPLNLDLARETYLTAWSAASLAGHLAGAGDVFEVSRAARALPPPGDPPRPIDLLLDGLARQVTDSPAAAAPALRQAVNAFTAGKVSREEGLRWGWIAATVLWDEDAGRAIIARQVQLARDAGALEQLPTDLVALAMSDAWRGEFAAAASLIAETDAVAEVTGSRIARIPRCSSRLCEATMPSSRR